MSRSERSVTPKNLSPSCLEMASKLLPSCIEMTSKVFDTIDHDITGKVLS